MLSPADLPDPGIKPGSPALQAVSLPTEKYSLYIPSTKWIKWDSSFFLNLSMLNN